jgi:nucleoside-diphosphate-sugar epimerase
MDILLLGGTGAMGVHLVQILKCRDNNVYVTSRKYRLDDGNVHYIQGNAHETNFLEPILTKKTWDAIVDFMIYSLAEFEHIAPLLLKSTNQYIFLSSSRVFAESESRLIESSNRLWDVSTDKIFLNANEYALSKAREENFLCDSQYRNWTIVRPYITFSENRLQLGVLEKERWLYRALHGRTIIFSEDIATKFTTLTYAYDVSSYIYSLIGMDSALGQDFNVTTSEYHTWQEILNVYLNVIRTKLNREPKVLITKDYKSINGIAYQVKYDREYNRTFDNSKICSYSPAIQFSPVLDKLKECLNVFLSNPSFLKIDWAEQAFYDKISKEFTPLWEIKGFRDKLVYLHIRYLKK